MTARAPALLFRLACSVLVFAYALAVWGSGFDRLSARDPALARLVPGPFRAQALRSETLAALARAEKVRTPALAEEALRADPLEALSLSLLGSARLVAGDAESADAAFRIAAARGWRDLFAQLYWFDRAIELGDRRSAALRFDAIMRAHPDFTDRDLLLETLERDEEGRAALAERLAESPRWAHGYFQDGGDVNTQTLVLRARVAQQVAALGRPLGCTIPRPLALALLDRGRRREAAALWQANCSAGGPADGLSDGGFEEFVRQGSNAPFGWRRHPRGDVTVDLIDAGGGNFAVRARNAASATRLLLSQALALESGRYVVRGEIRAGDDPAEGRIAISLDCGGSAHRPDRVVGDAAGSGQILDSGVCEGQTIGLWLRPGEGEVTLDNITLERLTER